MARILSNISGLGLFAVCAGGALLRSLRSISSSNDSRSRLRFVFDAENEVPVFYANRIGSFWFEQDYHALFRRAYGNVSSSDGSDGGNGSMEYAKLDPNACVAAMEAIGHTPANREIGICLIPKAFYEKKCFEFRRWAGELMRREFFYHDVLLMRRKLQSLLIEEELSKNGVVRRSRFVRMKASIDSATVKHGIEVELMNQHGSNFVIFLSSEEMDRRSAILRELEKAGVCIDDGIKLQLWRPEDDELYADTPVPTEAGGTASEKKKIKRMHEKLAMTHCRPCARTEAEPVEWYEKFPSRPLYGRDYKFTSDKLVIDIDTTRWRRNERAIPWEERLLATRGGKPRETLTILEIDGSPADQMLPKQKIRGWISSSCRRKTLPPSGKIQFSTHFLKK